METGQTVNESNLPGDELVIVAEIMGAFGLDGGLKIQPFATLEYVLAPEIKLFIHGTPVHIEYIHWGSRHPILRLAGIKTRDQAAALAGKSLAVLAVDLPTLPENEYYHYQLLDIDVWTTESEYLGRVKEILPTGSNDVLVVGYEPGPQVLIPMIKSVIVDISISDRNLTVDLPEGIR